MPKQPEIDIPASPAYTIECDKCKEKTKQMVLVVMQKSISPESSIGTCRICGKQHYRKIQNA